MAKTLKEMMGANMSTRDLHKHVQDKGWELTRTSGGHDVYTHAKSPKNIAIPRHGKKIKAPVVLGIMKTARQLGEENETMEKKEMAETQLHFIKYAAEEIIEYISMGGEIEEWYQNKLKVHSDMEGMHSWVEGEKRRVGMVKEDSEQLDELSKGTLKSYIQKSTAPSNNDPEDRVTLPGRESGVVKASYRTQGMAHTKGKEGMRKYKMQEEVESLEEGRPSQAHPLEGHEYHRKSNEELIHIAKDAHKVHSDMEGMHSWVEGEKRRVGMVKEDSEQLDEISKKTLGSYIKKATDDVSDKSFSSGRRSWDDPHAVKLDREVEKRRDNIAKATDRLTKEEKESDHDFKVGDKVHLGLKQKGGAGMRGTLHKIDGDTVHVNLGKEKFGDRIVRGQMKNLTKEEVSLEEKKMEGEDPCWKGYEMVGKKMKNGKEVPNCVPVKEQYDDEPYKKYHQDSPYKSERMARTKHLVKTAAKRKAERLGESFTLEESRRTEIVREAMQKAKDKKKKESKNDSSFQPDPELSTAINKTDV